MELTITQNAALYLAGKRITQKRRAFLQRFRAAADKQGPDVRFRRNFVENLVRRRYHRDNGR